MPGTSERPRHVGCVPGTLVATVVLAWLFGRLSRPSPHTFTRRLALTLAGLFQSTETPRPKLPRAVSVQEAVRNELAPPGRAPCVGEHSEEVLREWLGCDAGRIAALRRSGALGGGRD